jgi:hypothetical protein
VHKAVAVEAAEHGAIAGCGAGGHLREVAPVADKGETSRARNRSQGGNRISQHF